MKAVSSNVSWAYRNRHVQHSLHHHWFDMLLRVKAVAIAGIPVAALSMLLWVVSSGMTTGYLEIFAANAISASIGHFPAQQQEPAGAAQRRAGPPSKVEAGELHAESIPLRLGEALEEAVDIMRTRAHQKGLTF